jgi:hypothetical protein
MECDMITELTLRYAWILLLPQCALLLLLALLLNFCLSFQCKPHPEPALYNGGVLRWASKIADFRTEDEGNYSPAFVLYNMSAATAYSFSCKFFAASSCMEYLLAVRTVARL